MRANSTPADELNRVNNHTTREQPVEQPLYVPERSRVELCIAFSLFVFSVAYLCLFLRYTTMEPDEGIILQGAQRILRGEVLYRDFFSFLTPGSHYFLALIFGIFGSSFIVARIFLALLGATTTVVSYLLTRRVCSRRNALTVVILMTFTTFPFRFLVLHNWDSTFWACLTVYSAVRWLESSHWIWPIATGSFASITFLFEQSKGAGLLLGLSVGLLTIKLLQPFPVLRSMKVSKIRFLGLGLIWPILVTLLYFGSRHVVGLMLADWLWPLQHYSIANRVPYGYQNWSDETRQVLFGTNSAVFRFVTALALSPCFVIPALPLIGLGIWTNWIRKTRNGGGQNPRRTYYLMMGALLAGLLLSVAVGRADIIHFVYLQPLFCIVLAWIIDGRDIGGKLFQVVRPGLIVYLILGFALISVPLAMRATRAPHRTLTRRGTIFASEKDTVLDYVQRHASPGESIFIYPYLPLYYYLTNTFSPTHYDYFQPGMNTPQQAQEIISEVAAKDSTLVIFEYSFYEKIPTSWPETPISSIVRDPVADFIVRNYRICAVLQSPERWRFFAMVPKKSSCPQG